MSSVEGRTALVTGGRGGSGRRSPCGWRPKASHESRSATCGTTRLLRQAADEVRTAGAEPMLVRGNVASDRVIAEFASHGPYAVVVHNAATGVIKPALETEDKHWDWTLQRQRPRASVTRAGVCARHGERLVDRRDLLARLATRARELRPGRHVEGRARVRRALSRGRARAPRDPRQRRLGGRRRDGSARPLPQP